MSARVITFLIAIVLVWTGSIASDPVGAVSSFDSAASGVAMLGGNDYRGPANDGSIDSHAGSDQSAPTDADGDADLSDLCPVFITVHDAAFSMEPPGPYVLTADQTPYSDAEHRPPRAQRQAA
jgi:hypothetical protein